MDYQSLDKLADDIYVYYYNIRIHKKKKQIQFKRELKESLSKLNQNELDYVKIKAIEKVRDTFGEKSAKI